MLATDATRFDSLPNYVITKIDMSSHAYMGLLCNNLQSTSVVGEESSDTFNLKSDFSAEIQRPKNISMPQVRA